MVFIEPSRNIQFHLTDRKGLYTLVSYNNDYFKYKTRHSEIKTLPFYKFKCLHGTHYHILKENEEVQCFLLAMSLDSRKGKQVWAEYCSYDSFLAFDQMSKEELERFFS